MIKRRFTKHYKPHKNMSKPLNIALQTTGNYHNRYVIILIIVIIYDDSLTTVFNETKNTFSYFFASNMWISRNCVAAGMSASEKV